eukprot:7106805-Karenia_brevis.AAC.1
MAMMRRDFEVEKDTHLVRLVARSKKDRLKDLYMPRKFRAPYRGFPASYNGKRGATLEIIIKRSDGVIEKDVDKQMPGMDSTRVRKLL